MAVVVGDEEAAPAEDLVSAALTLARRFASGATMWCVAPQWPAHGWHMAVEFVHPVIVGKPALPAVNLEGSDIAGTLRLLARPGDVVVAASTADNAETLDLLARSEAWGLTRIWLGAGGRPARVRAEHVVWVEDIEAPVAARSGDIVLLYHLLWELSHVVFEHPGLLSATPACPDAVCMTCSDEGRVGEVRTLGADGTADVLVRGVLETVDLNLVAPVAPGALVLVHAGVALTTLDGESSGFGDVMPASIAEVSR